MLHLKTFLLRLTFIQTVLNKVILIQLGVVFLLLLPASRLWKRQYRKQTKYKQIPPKHVAVLILISLSDLGLHSDSDFHYVQAANIFLLCLVHHTPDLIMLSWQLAFHLKKKNILS